MGEFWASMTLFQQIIFLIAIPASLILVLQFVLLLFGLGDSSDMDTDCDLDVDGDGLPDELGNADDGMDFLDIGGLKLFTFRGVLAFLSIGGWTALLVSISQKNWVAALAGAGAGLAADLLYALIMKGVKKLQCDGTLDTKNTVGLCGEVYIPIPPHLTGRGKVNVVVQGALTELEAVCDGDGFIKTGTRVLIVAEDGGVLTVLPASEIKSAEQASR